MIMIMLQGRARRLSILIAIDISDQLTLPRPEGILDQPHLTSCFPFPFYADDIKSVVYFFFLQTPHVDLRCSRDAFLLCRSHGHLGRAGFIGGAGFNLNKAQDRTIPANQVQFARIGPQT